MAITHAWHDLTQDMRDEVHDIATIGRADAARQAYLGLWATFMALPLIFGVDKLAGFMTENWEAYVATWVDDALPGTASDAIIWFGVVEIVLAIAVLVVPRVGGDLLALWMVLAAISLFSISGMVHLGIAACALAICALAMARLSTTYHHTEG